MIAPVTKADLSRVGRSGARSRHGRSIVYVDGAPYDKAELAKRHGLAIERITDRERALRRRGRPITLQALTRPTRGR